jgi:hypothetical protein
MGSQEVGVLDIRWSIGLYDFGFLDRKFSLRPSMGEVDGLDLFGLHCWFEAKIEQRI